MQTRRDQVQAYRFAQTRVQSALLSGEPDRRDPPLRRQGLAGFAGLMVAVLVAAGFGIYGLVRPGGKQGWRTAGTLVVEQETGARFVFDPADGALHPVLNYASARLILNAPTVAVRQFSRESLASAPRGPARGLPGLPDAFPGPSGLLRGPWRICSGSTADGAASMTVTVGAGATGQRLDRQHGLLVRLPDRRTFLIWNDTRLEITKPAVALPALGLENAVPVQVSKTWVNSVTPGPDLSVPVLGSIGTQVGYRVGSSTVYLGQVHKVDAAGGVGVRYYLTLPDGLAPIPATVALLLLGDPHTRYAYGMKSPEAFSRASADISAAPRSSSRVTPDGFPDEVPALAQPVAGATASEGSGAACAVYSDTSGRTTASAVYSAGRDGGAVPATGEGVNVLLPPGRAAVIRMLPYEGRPSEAVYLVTDTGAKFPVPSADALRAIGLGDVEPVPLPSGIAELIPTGPALDQSRANLDVAVTRGSPAGSGSDTAAPAGSSTGA